MGTDLPGMRRDRLWNGEADVIVEIINIAAEENENEKEKR